MVSKNLSVCLSVYLSVCLSVTEFDPNYLRTSKTEWGEKIFRTSMAKSHVPKFLSLPRLAPFPEGSMKFATQISPLLNYINISTQHVEICLSLIHSVFN